MSESQGSNGGPPRSGAQREQSPPRRTSGRRPSFFWPLLLIGVGVILLLANLGYVPWESWSLLWRLWPLLLIALGIDVLIGHRSLVGALISGILTLILIGAAILFLLFAPDIPALERLGGVDEWQIEQIEYPLDGVESASVRIDWPAVPGHLSSLSDSPNLIEGTVSYRGDLVFDVDPQEDHVEVELDTVLAGLWPPFAPAIGTGAGAERTWDVELNPNVALELLLDVGSGDCFFDLTGLEISDLSIDGGSGDMDLILPSDSSFDVDIDGGSGAIVISLPLDVGVQLHLDSGSGAFDPGDRLQLVEGEAGDTSTWETENFATAEVTIRLEVDQGSGALGFE